MKNVNRRFILLFVWALSGLLATACSSSDDGPKPEVLRPVRYIEVPQAGGGTAWTFSGVSKSGTVYRISFRVSGKLKHIHVKNSSLVKKNQLIAELDDSDARLKYEKSLASLNKAEVFKNTAQSNLKRIRDLYENDAVSLSDYEAAKDNFANAKASFLSEKRNVNLQEKELGYYKLYAPESGVISGKSMEMGENISAGQVVAQIIDTDTMDVTAGISENLISFIHEGAAVTVEFTALAGKIFQGEVTEVAFSVDKDSSTYPVTIRVINPSRDIRPGMPGRVSFNMTDVQNDSVVFVPVPAVAEDASGHFVYVVTAESDGVGTVSRRPVSIGKMTDRGFEIINGVNQGDKVVTAGISKLSDGLKVLMR